MYNNGFKKDGKTGSENKKYWVSLMFLSLVFAYCNPFWKTLLKKI